MLDRPLPKVLVVDDEPSMRTFLREALKPFVAKIAEAADAPQALNAIESGDFDIVLSDWYMPGANGLELLAMAQQSQWDVSFILTTGRPDVEQIIAALRLQASDFLVKPFTLQALTEAVGQATGGCSPSAKPARIAGRSKPASNAARATWKVRCGTSNPTSKPHWKRW